MRHLVNAQMMDML